MRTIKELKSIKHFNVNRHAVHQREWGVIKKEAITEMDRVNLEYNTNITYNEKDNGIYFSTGQFLLKPKYPSNMVGTIEIRSNDYIFRSEEMPNGCYGNIPKAHELTRDASGDITGFVVITNNKENINYTFL